MRPVRTGHTRTLLRWRSVSSVVDFFPSGTEGIVNRRMLTIGALVLAGGAVCACAWRQRDAAEAHFTQEVRAAVAHAAHIRSTTVQFVERAFPSGAAFHQVLIHSGIDSRLALRIADSAASVFNMRQIRAGNRMGIGHSLDGVLRAVRYQIDLERTLLVASSVTAPDEFRAEIKVVPAIEEVATVSGAIDGSLFEGVIDAGEKPELAILLADIFGWDLDFHSDPRRGDTFRVAVEKKKYQGGEVRYTRIVAAEYVNAGKPYCAVLFRDPSGKPAYYAPDGSSLQKAFLRSPLKFSAPITSRFSRSRFHPILRRHRPHLGIDYGAPHGAAVQAIGEGRVVFAGRKGGSGNIVQIRHANGFETMYLHLSKIGVRPGQRVGQGDIIGRVGSTGLSTAPHLDFRITQNGAYRNFAALNLPPAEPVARSLRDEFAVEREKALALLATQN